MATFHTFSRSLVRALGLNRRYGVKFNGDQERTGFRTRGHAEGWAAEHTVAGKPLESFIVWQYEPAIDMRLPGQSAASRDAYAP